MKKTLLALAAAGVLASTGAIAANGIDAGGPVMTPVQYRDHDYRNDERYRQWYDRSENIYDRGQRVHNWIERGISDGRLNQWEARRLERQMARFEAKERDFNRDGRINRREADELNRDLDRLADNVREQMRD